MGAKLTWPDVRKIRERWATGNWTVASLATVYGVREQAIKDIVHNISWREGGAWHHSSEMAGAPAQTPGAEPVPGLSAQTMSAAIAILRGTVAALEALGLSSEQIVHQFVQVASPDGWWVASVYNAEWGDKNGSLTLGIHPGLAAAQAACQEDYAMTYDGIKEIEVPQLVWAEEGATWTTVSDPDSGTWRVEPVSLP